MNYSYEDVAKMIDHSLLFPTLTAEDLERGCRLALKYNVASACIMPYYLRRCAEIFKDSTVNASTTIGYPHGCNTTAIKVAEARHALDDGAKELDMVVNISKVLSEDWAYVRRDIDAVVDVAHERGQKVKVILENSYLEDKHKIRLCQICGELMADWVKASSGFTVGVSPAATDADLRLMRKHSPAHVQIKSSGQERNLDELLALREMGVTRVGITATAEVLEECKRRLGERNEQNLKHPIHS